MHAARLIIGTVCSILLGCLPVFAQQIEVKIQAGLPEYIEDFALHPYNSRLAVLGGNKIGIFNIRNGMEEQAIDLTADDLGGIIPHLISYTSDGNMLYVIGEDSKMIWWDTKTLKIVRTFSDEEGYDRTAHIAAGNAFLMYTAESQSSLYLGNTTNGITKKVSTIDENISFHAAKAGWDAKGMIYSCQTSNSGVAVFDLKQKEKIWSYTGNDEKYWNITRTAVNAQKNLLAIASNKMTTTDDKEYIFKKLDDEIKLKRAAGELLMCSEIDLIDIKTNKTIKSFRGHQNHCLVNCHNEINLLEFSPSESFLISADDSLINVWNLEKMALQYAINIGTGIGSKLKFSDDGNLFILFNDNGFQFYDLRTGVLLNDLFTLPKSDSLSVVAFNEEEGTLKTMYSELGQLRTLNLSQNRITIEEITPFKIPELDYKEVIRFMDALKTGTVDVNQFSPYLVQRMALNQFKLSNNSNTISLIKINFLKAQSDTILKCTGDFTCSAVIKYTYNADSSLIALGQDSIGVFDLSQQKFLFSHYMPNTVNYIFSDKGNYLLVLNWDKSITMLNTRTGEELAKLYQFEEIGSFITADKYYWSNKEALNYASFESHAVVYPFQQFDKRFNRPDVILKRIMPASKTLIKLYHDVCLMRDSNILSTQSNLHAIPSVSIINANTIPLLTQNATLGFPIEVDGKGEQVDKVSVFINGVPANQILIGQVINKQQFNIDALPLSEGRNRIKVVVSNSTGMTSMAEEVHIVYHPSQQKKRKVFLAMLGVDDYEQLADLPGTESSLDSIAQYFTQRYGTSVDLSTRAFKGTQVNQQNLSSITEFFSAASTNDLVILLISGHGILSLADKEFYYALPSADLSKDVSPGIPFSDIYAMFGNLTARNRMFFIDACFSGKTSGSDDSSVKEAYDVLNSQFVDTEERNGVNVISAASGDNIALGNSNGGLLSLAVISCLADFDHMSTDQLPKSINEYFKRFKIFDLPMPDVRHSNVYHSFKIW